MKKLNIYVCLITEESESLWHRQITWSLQAMGHSVFTSQQLPLRQSWLTPYKYWGEEQKVNLTQLIIDDVKKEHANAGIDLFFCYLFDFQFKPFLFTELEKVGIPSLYFFCDNFSHPQIARDYAPSATLNWVPEWKATEQFKQSKSKYIYLPMAANPQLNFPLDTTLNEDVTFIGSKNNYRGNILKSIIDNGYPLKIYGDNWVPSSGSFHDLEGNNKPTASEYKSLPFKEQLQRFIYWRKQSIKYQISKRLNPQSKPTNNISEFDFSEHTNKELLDWKTMNEYTFKAKVCLGINDKFITDANGTPCNYMKMRDFEAAMSGACYLTQNTPESEWHFHEGHEVMRYTYPEEMLEKLSFLLKNENFRNKLKINIRARALKDHTWESRFNEAFKALNLLPQ